MSQKNLISLCLSYAYSILNTNDKNINAIYFAKKLNDKLCIEGKDH